MRTTMLATAAAAQDCVETALQRRAQWRGVNLRASSAAGRVLVHQQRAGLSRDRNQPAGRRLTMLIGRNDENSETSFRLDVQDPLRTFYWIDGPIGYAVTGEISAEALRAVADECYRQMEDA